jgi:hypothetical protein
VERSPRADRGYWQTLAATLVGGAVAFLIAASQTDCRAWAVFFVVAAVASLLAGAYVFGALFVGRGLPDLGEERRRKRQQSEHEALLASYARRDAFQELLDELEHLRRALGIELGNNRTYGVMHPATAWAKNRHVLRDHPDTRDLVRDAYERINALNERTRERYDAASHADVNNPAWLRLSEDEAKERAEALSAVEHAITAVKAVAASEQLPA